MSVQAYDVEFTVKVKSTGEQSVTCRREYAYSVSDAFSQATMNLMASFGPGGHTLVDVHLLKIGPPREYVEAASQGLAAQVKELMDRVKRRA